MTNQVYLLVAFGLVMLMVGCWQQKDYGFGLCNDYRPSCSEGYRDCERDSRGCEQCTCRPANSRDNDLLKPNPRRPRDPTGR